jgi:PAS domain S-box-containing protein
VLTVPKMNASYAVEWPISFQAVIEQAPDAMIFADREGAIRIWNQAAEAMFGYSSAEVLGKSLDVMIPERLRAAHWKGFDHALASGKTKYAGQPMTTRATHKDGSKVYVDMSFGLVKDEAGNVTGALAIARKRPSQNPA